MENKSKEYKQNYLLLLLLSFTALNMKDDSTPNICATYML